MAAVLDVAYGRSLHDELPCAFQSAEGAERLRQKRQLFRFLRARRGRTGAHGRGTRRGSDYLRFRLPPRRLRLSEFRQKGSRAQGHFRELEREDPVEQSRTAVRDFLSGTNV